MILIVLSHFRLRDGLRAICPVQGIQHRITADAVILNLIQCLLGYAKRFVIASIKPPQVICPDGGSRLLLYGEGAVVRRKKGIDGDIVGAQLRRTVIQGLEIN